jgi:ABC-2 type transport system ATP-binding protein
MRHAPYHPARPMDGSAPEASEVPAIEARGLSKRYADHSAVEDLSFAIYPGEVVGLLGPNGAGKTTTMRMLTGYLPPTEGSIAIAGFDVFEDPIEARRRVGYLPESPPVYPEMRVEAYLRFVATLRDVPRRSRREAVAKAIARCGLEAVRRRAIGSLSRGFRQRVGLAQAIVADPPVLVLDEPTVGLDPLQVREIRTLVTGLAKGGATRGPTVLLSTHILREVEALCQRVILMDRGRLALDAPIAEVTAGGRSLEDVFAEVTASDVEAERGR